MASSLADSAWSGWPVRRVECPEAHHQPGQLAPIFDRSRLVDDQLPEDRHGLVVYALDLSSLHRWVE